MKLGYIPQSDRKKILLLSDDLRVPSGVGVMSREIVEQTAHQFNWVQVGAAIQHPDYGKVIDMNSAINEATGLEDAYLRIYPFNGYGNSQLIRQLLDIEKPDAIMLFTDPRYFIWFFQIEHEIRQRIPVFYYNIWDDLPYPMYNKNFYRSVNALFAISKQTYNINKQVLGDNKDDVVIRYLPHGIDTKKYFPITPDNEEHRKIMEEMRTKLFGDKQIDYVVFYNARNIRRKQTSDLLLAFGQFIKKLTPEQAEKCRLLLHTQPVDDAGTDLLTVINDVVPHIKNNVVFSSDRIDPKYLNTMYNLSDVTVNIASNEGFGLGTCESLLVGTPIIVNSTGGLQDQCGFIDNEGNLLDPDTHFSYEWGSNHDGRYKKCGDWAFPVWPVSRSLQGSPLTPYIFDDRVDWNDVANRLYEVYLMSREERKERGMKGREFALGAGMFTSQQMGNLFIQYINEGLQNFVPRKKFELVKV